jgi:mono/diheme cytochrome c family protein
MHLLPSCHGAKSFGLFVGCALVCSGPAAVGAETETAKVNAGRQLFVRFCTRCHGDDGRGGPGRVTMPVIPDFTDPSFHQTHSDIQMTISILEGKDRLMPANRGPVSDEQAPELVAYIRTFGPARPAAAGPATDKFDFEFRQLQQQADDLDRQIRELPTTPAPGSAAIANLVNRSFAPGSAQFFAQNCAGCHTIGGGAMTGPDLRHVTGRRDRGWLVQYLQNPKAVIDSGDPYILHLLAEARGVVMPRPFGMTRERAESILDFIAAESKREKSQFAGPPVPDTPFPPGDAARGKELFAGIKRLANGGPACINCHSLNGLEGREGGRLGPELTKVYERVGGRTSLTARLWAPATPTMLPVYKDHSLQLDEVMSLVAYLEETDRQGVEVAAAPPVKFFLLGLGGAVLGLVGVNYFWGSRRRPRQPPLSATGIATGTTPELAARTGTAAGGEATDSLGSEAHQLDHLAGVR